MLVKDMSAEDRRKLDSELTSVADTEEANEARNRQLERERQARKSHI